MATPRQIAANRQNARKSTGPKTAGGKKASRQNALTHGLAGDGPVVEEEFAAAVAERVEAFRSLYPTYNASDEWSLEQLAILTFRVSHAQRLEAKLVLEGQHRAHEHWDDDQFQHAEDVARRLAKAPMPTVRALSTFKHGCLWLADAWRELLPFATPELWTEAHDQRAHDLAGDHPEFRCLKPWTGRLTEHITELAEYYEAQALAYESADERARQYALNGTPLTPPAELARVRRYESALYRRYDQMRHTLNQSHQAAVEQGLAPLPVPPPRDRRSTLRESDVTLTAVETLPVTISSREQELVAPSERQLVSPHAATPTNAIAPEVGRAEARNRRERRLLELKARKRAKAAREQAAGCAAVNRE